MMYSSLHVHRFFAGYPPVFYEGQPSPLGRLSGFFAEVNLLGPSLLAEEVVVVVNIPVTYLLVIHYDRSTTAPRMTN